MRTDPEDMAFLLCQNKGDIRRSILQLQLWACSGGGRTELQILKDTLKVSQINIYLSKPLLLFTYLYLFVHIFSVDVCNSLLYFLWGR